ncbi:MAG TPA: hypothetical protein PLF50_02260 [Candidatus Cloacimonadota bacterium]|nr:hypothetical protein [Candidatus Cloacimonadota bacterium]
MPAFRVKINPAMLLPEYNRLLIYATIKIGGYQTRPDNSLESYVTTFVA